MLFFFGLVPPGTFDLCGSDKLQELESVRFTFNVEKNGELKARRSWVYQPQTKHLVRTVDGVRLEFQRGEPKTEQERVADAQFTNDFFWFHPPVQIYLASDDLKVTDGGAAKSPIHHDDTHRLLMSYRAEGGGYTPGDSYELYLDDAGKIVEWSYHKAGAPEPTLTNTFEQYQQVGPLRIATEHLSADKTFHLFFQDVAVEPLGSN